MTDPSPEPGENMLPPQPDTPLCALCLDEEQETPGSCCVSAEIKRGMK